MMRWCRKWSMLAGKLQIGDPTDRVGLQRPGDQQRQICVIIRHSANNLHTAGKVLTGGKILTDGAFRQRDISARIPSSPASQPIIRSGKTEMFLPISMVTAVDSWTKAMQRANNVLYGLTAGFYGTPDEVGLVL